MAKSSRTIGSDARVRIRRAIPSMTKGVVEGKGFGTFISRTESEYRQFVSKEFSAVYESIAKESLNKAGTKPALAAIKDVDDYLGRLSKQAVKVWDSPKFKAILDSEKAALLEAIKKAYRDNLGHDEFLSIVRRINDSDFFERLADTSAGYIRISGKMYRIDKLMQVTTQVNAAQTQREAVITKARKQQNDLVEVIGPRDSKDFCSRLVGKVFSISGKSKTYPALKDLPNGGPPFHPHCRHTIVPADDVVTQMASAAETPKYLLTSDSADAEKAHQRKG